MSDRRFLWAEYVRWTDAALLYRMDGFPDLEAESWKMADKYWSAYIYAED